MSKDDIAAAVGEHGINDRTNTLTGLILALAAKYGLPALCCAWLFYVIWCKDQQIFAMVEKVTAALVESNHARAEDITAKKEQAEAIQKLADAVNGLPRK